MVPSFSPVFMGKKEKKKRKKMGSSSGEKKIVSCVSCGRSTHDMEAHAGGAELARLAKML